MQSDQSNIWKGDQAQQLAEALVMIDDLTTMKNFLRDVMTEKEIIEISSRLQAARMLSRNETYASITQETKLSSRTIARINDWMQNGCGGYEAALRKISAHHLHIPPAHAE